MKRTSLVKLGFISLALLFVLFMVPLNAFAETEDYEYTVIWDKGYDNERYRCVTTIDGTSTATGNEKRLKTNGSSSTTNYWNQPMEASFSDDLSNGYSLSFKPSTGVKLEWLKQEANSSFTTEQGIHCEQTSTLEFKVQVPPHYSAVLYRTERIETTTFKTVKYHQIQHGPSAWDEDDSNPIVIYSTATEKYYDYSAKPELAPCEADKYQAKQKMSDGTSCYKCRFLLCDKLVPAVGEHTCSFKYPDNAGCSTISACVICDKYGPVLGHDFANATCTEPKKCTRCGVTSGSPLGHEYSLPATCVTPVMCSRCGETLGEPLGHNFLGATCTAPKTCTRCHLPSGEPLGHNWTGGSCTVAQKCSRCGINGNALGHYLFESTVSPTCTANGSVRTYCNRIGCNYEVITVLPAYGHSYSFATCTSAKKCSRCGVTSGEPLGHNWKEATCTDAKKCTRCGLTSDPALGHYLYESTTSPTCTAAGSVKTYCLRTDCDYEVVTSTSPALGHSYSSATCTSPKKCTRCGATSGSALGHNYSAATCTSAKKCSRCGATSGSALGHNYSAATCLYAKKCSRCGATSGSALGHNYSAATCTSAKKCSRCGATSGSALGHNYSAATCLYAKKCSRCGATSGSALGHNYASATCNAPRKCTRCNATTGTPLGHNFTSATCTAAKKCKRCGQTSGSALGHSWGSWTVVTAPSATNPGRLKRVCSRCKKTEYKNAR